MSKLYQIKPDCVSEWKSRMSPEDYERLCGQPFDIDVIVDLSKEWDTALYKMLNQVEVVKNDS
ncbi:MAG: hypothetical protein IKS34_01675 [Clostridia bacterium]|nr:hypothetical protein [Clostridia bacterium]MBR4466991.1 hypothetical protein [Clostridia bacterium]